MTQEGQLCLCSVGIRHQSWHSMTLSQEVDAVLLSDMCRMYTKGPLDFAEKVYSYASAELG